jgi:hypothetical protein
VLFSGLRCGFYCLHSHPILLIAFVSVILWFEMWLLLPAQPSYPFNCLCYCYSLVWDVASTACMLILSFSFLISRVGHNYIYTVNVWYFWQEITKYTVIYGVYIWFWPTLLIWLQAYACYCVVRDMFVCSFVKHLSWRSVLSFWGTGPCIALNNLHTLLSLLSMHCTQ